MPSIFAYFYPRPPRGGRPSEPKEKLLPICISIHALREEGDRVQVVVAAEVQISIHALREEGDLSLSAKARSFRGFLSTPSARRATATFSLEQARPEISIHALREEGDLFLGILIDFLSHFYPRPPRGGRPVVLLYVASTSGFLSTPSARRATAQTRKRHSCRFHFYPRPPRGGRLNMPDFMEGTSVDISIHALREEGDRP